MSYNEDEELEPGFKAGADEDELGEPLDADMPDFPLNEDEEEDPENRFH